MWSSHRYQEALRSLRSVTKSFAMVALSKTRRRLPPASRVGVPCVAAASVALAAVTSLPESAVVGVMVAVAVILIVIAAKVGLHTATNARSSPVVVGFLGVVGLAFVIVAGALAGVADSALGVAAICAGAIALWWLLRWSNIEGGRLSVVAVLCVLILAIVSVGAIGVLTKPTIDVIAINEAGASALLDGVNPYVAAATQNTNRYLDEPALIEGYAYPPLALITYTLSDWLFGDTRWVNALALVAVALILVWPRRWSGEPVPVAVAAVPLAIALLPSLGHVLRQGWTEPISLPLLAAAVYLWRRRPVEAAVLLGLAVATKQYFVLLAPMILLWNDEHRMRRSMIVGGVVALTVAPFLIWDAGSLWDAVVFPSLEAAPRPDSMNLIALGITPPSWASWAAAAAIGVALGLRGGGGSKFAIGVAAVMGSAFLVGFQAFANYWFLIFGLCVIAVGGAYDEHRREVRPAPESRARNEVAGAAE